MAGQAAARLHDPVAHSDALAGFLAGAVVGVAAAIGVAVVVGMAATAVAAEVASAGLATPLIAGAAVTIGEFGVNAVVGGVVTKAAEDAGEALGSKRMGPTSGAISDGSGQVHINGLQAARALDPDTCHASKIAQGSKIVSINGRPAARVGDKLTCGGAITGGSKNVMIGGPPATMAPIQSEVPTWVRWAVVVASLLPALGAAARAVGPAIAEAQAGGIGRALQVGAKAVGRAMESRAGGAKVPPADALRTATRAELDQMRADGASNKRIGPAISTAMDTRTGQMSKTYINNSAGDPPADLHPTIADRMDAAQELPYDRSHGAGSHSEVYATNELMQNGSQMSDISVYTEQVGGRNAGTVKPPCPHCATLLDGVNYVH